MEQRNQLLEVSRAQIRAAREEDRAADLALREALKKLQQSLQASVNGR